MRLVTRAFELLLAASCALAFVAPVIAQTPLTTPDAKAPESRDARVAVKDAGALGGDIEMAVKVYVPDRAGPFPVVLYSHGRAADDFDRRKLSQPVPLGHVAYWQRKGFAVVAPIRPGYGETGGADREQSGSSFDNFGNCRSKPDFEGSAKNATAATLSALEWIRQQPWANKERILLVGTSMGGFTTVSTAATNPPGVVGYVNFAGGSGGNPQRAPARSCGVAEMEKVMAGFGRTTTVPNLWLYAENDQYWGAEAPKVWYAAFAAGGSPSKFVQTGPVPGYDGHQLMLRGGRLWSVHVDAFVQALGL